MFATQSCANRIPWQKAAVSGGVLSTVVVVAGMTVVTAYLLCRQTAAPGYAEVLAHLSVHSTPPSPPAQTDFPFWGNHRLRLPIPQGVCMTGRFAHLRTWSIFWDHLMTTINWTHHKHKHVQTQTHMLVHSLLRILRIIVDLLHTHTYTPDTVCLLSS